MPELKPCPFCGSPEVAVQEDWPAHFVRCGNCWVHGPSYDNDAKAIERWNTRPAEDALAAQVATLTAERDIALAARDVAIAAQRLQLKVSDDLAEKLNAAQKALIKLFAYAQNYVGKDTLRVCGLDDTEALDAALQAAKE